MIQLTETPSAGLPFWAKSTRAPLATADGVAMLIQQPIKTVYARADGGDKAGDCYQFVFNVATNPAGKIRNLRFWLGEIDDPPAVANLTLADVLAIILPPTRGEFPAGAVCQLLQVRDVTLAQLRSELGGSLRRNCGVYPRAGLVKFFQTRWLGAASSN